MGDTFGGEHHRLGKNHQRGHSQRELQDRASFDNVPQLGCGAMLLLCILAAAAAIGMGLT
jgi:hypothetical protein